VPTKEKLEAALFGGESSVEIAKPFINTDAA
jgi:hypothetical protein